MLKLDLFLVFLMPLLLTGNKFRRDLEREGALALYVPLEGGAETRLMRRLRTTGYKAFLTSARGIGDPETYLLRTHGQNAAHLGRFMLLEGKGEYRTQGSRQNVMPLLGPLLMGDSPILLWMIEGHVLSSSELNSLAQLSKRESRLKIVIEMGGARSLQWHPLSSIVVN